MLPRNACVGVKKPVKREANHEVSGRTRNPVDVFGMHQSPGLCAMNRSADCRSAAKSPSAIRFAVTSRECTLVFPGSGMSVAGLFPMRVADRSAQPGQEEAV